jgi:predicted ribosomally synthesized peptide with nif11-like leader
MSQEELRAFAEAVKADAGLQDKLNSAADADAVVAIAKAAGFTISVEAVVRKQELTDEELEAAAGGMTCSVWCLAAGMKDQWNETLVKTCQN